MKPQTKISDIANKTPPIIPPIRGQFLDDFGDVSGVGGEGVIVCVGIGVSVSVGAGVALEEGVGADVCVGVDVGVGIGVGVGAGVVDGVGVDVGVGDGPDPDGGEDGGVIWIASINRPESKKRSSWSATVNCKV